MKNSYSFTILRYIHDGLTQEFVNIGVVMYSAEKKFLKAKCTDKYSRISTMFEKIDGKSFRELTDYIESQVNNLGSKSDIVTIDNNDKSLDQLLTTILPRDDSSIQFSHVGAGITNSLEHELEALFDRYVSRYSSRSEVAKKSNSKVWSKFREALSRTEVVNKLVTHKIVAPNYEYEFKHAAKNGVWHLCEPISFDLSDDSAIVDKAISWIGTATALKKGKEEFKLNLLLGKPEDKRLEESYNNAKKLLDNIPVNKQLFEEEEADEFAVSLERDVLGH